MIKGTYIHYSMDSYEKTFNSLTELQDHAKENSSEGYWKTTINDVNYTIKNGNIIDLDGNIFAHYIDNESQVRELQSLIAEISRKLDEIS